MPRKATIRKTAPVSSEVINLFTGNIYDLVERLQTIPQEIEERYLKFANQPDKETAINRILAGDKETFERYQAHAKNLQFAGHVKKEMVFDNEGLFFDTATFLTGQPEYWINEVDATAPAPAKDIKINIAAPFWVKESDYFDKLIKIVELIDQAEANGQRLSIKATCHSYDYQNQLKGKAAQFTAEIEIKKESEPLNIQQLVYLLSNPILLRYAILSLQKAYGGLLNYNPAQYQPEEETEIKSDNIYIPSISYDFLNGICYVAREKFNYKNLNPLKQYNINL